MLKGYITRSLEPVILQAINEFPVVMLTGPRQSGKTTLLRHIFKDKYKYVSIEPPDVREAAISDPRGFLRLYSPPVIFDEIQYAPELLPYIKENVDENRNSTGQYIITGSQNLLLSQNISETLAGRVAVLRLLAMSKREIDCEAHRPLPWEKEGLSSTVSRWSYADLRRSLLRGKYPELISHPGRQHAMWHSSYIQTYLERDIRMLRRIGNLTLFQNFVFMLATRSGQLLNITHIARDLGVAVNTIKQWLSILETTYQVMFLRPYFTNIGKRLVKTPKIFFLDTGTLCYLVKEQNPDNLLMGPMGGAIFETAVFAEIIKVYTHRGEVPSIHFWRTRTGMEVDFVLEYDGKLVPIEVKTSATPRPAMGNWIRKFQEDFGEKTADGFVIHPGDITLPLGNRVTAIPFADL